MLQRILSIDIIAWVFLVVGALLAFLCKKIARWLPFLDEEKHAIVVQIIGYVLVIIGMLFAMKIIRI